MLGMKTPIDTLPQIQLTAGVVVGPHLFRKVLPAQAINVANLQIFTARNLWFILKYPDAVVRQFDGK
jgi:hypothetical protein